MNRPLFPLDREASRKPRTSRPKVKSGCKTWFCYRCTNFGRKCGGYAPKEEVLPRKEVITAPRKLISKPATTRPQASHLEGQSSSLLPSAPLQLDLPDPRPIIPAGLLFHDDREYRYFCHFRDVTSLELAGGFEPSLWTTVLGACSIPSIRQLTVAISAMSMALSEGHVNSSNQTNDRHSGGLHRQYALQQYGEALKDIGGSLPSGGDSVRVALISSLLIFCFESLLEDITQAIFHVHSAIGIIVKSISSLPRNCCFPHVGSLGVHNSSVISDDLLGAFMRLDRPSLALLSQQNGLSPGPSSRIFNLVFASERYAIPEVFQSVIEARKHLDDIKWRILPNDSIPSPVERLCLDASASNIPQLEAVPVLIAVWYEAARKEDSSGYLSDQFVQWHDAFSPLLNYAMTSAGDSIFIAAATMHIQALSADLLLTGYFAPSFNRSRSSSFSSQSTPPGFRQSSASEAPQLSLVVPAQSASLRQSTSQRSTPGPSPETDGYPTVHAILDFSRQLLRHPAFSRGFVFDVGIIPSLVTVMTSCPEISLRREAIGILRDMHPRREGIWDSRVCADAGEKSMARDQGAGWE